MKDAIERVMAELERKRQVNLDLHDYNVAGAYQEASDMLRGVLAEHEADRTD